MESKRGFVFSLDAFVAFSLALIIIYSLIFFSSVPYGYYTSFMQAHDLAKDTLTALSETKESQNDNSWMTKLEYIAIKSVALSSASSAASERIGPLIPNQFGYVLERSEDGKNWEKIYDTADNANDPHRKVYTKLKVSAQTLAFAYESEQEFPSNPYKYISCTGQLTQCGQPTPQYYKNESSVKIVKLTIYT